MDRFIPKEKLSKKSKRALDRAQRQVWSISPVTRMGKNRKAYLKDKTRYRTDDGIGSLVFGGLGAVMRMGIGPGDIMGLRHAGTSRAPREVHGFQQAYQASIFEPWDMPSRSFGRPVFHSPYVGKSGR